MAASQHRRVLVGNIPYDATEEQLNQICEEVGPVVSFRLVVDGETGKPKEYGFCEYKDEETALSARHNLQGYEINGRQLRVDFAENDKGSERSRENACLGGPQAAAGPSKNGPLQQPLGHDPLTVHPAKTSKSQPIQVMSEMKVLATENYDLARRNSMMPPLGMSAGPSKVNNTVNTSNRNALTPIELAKRKRKSTTMSFNEHMKFVHQNGEKMLSLVEGESENSFIGCKEKNYDFEDCYPVIERLIKEGLMVEESKLWCFTVTKLCNDNSRQAFMIMPKDSLRMAWLKFEYERTHKVVYTP